MNIAPKLTLLSTNRPTGASPIVEQDALHQAASPPKLPTAMASIALYGNGTRMFELSIVGRCQYTPCASLARS